MPVLRRDYPRQTARDGQGQALPLQGGHEIAALRKIVTFPLSSDESPDTSLERRLRLKVNGTLQQIARILEMLNHPAASLLRVSASNRQIDALVQLKSMFRLDELRGQPNEALERTMDDGEHQTADSIAGDPKDSLVKSHIGFDELVVLKTPSLHR